MGRKNLIGAGFTLVELLIVLAIVAILAALIISFLTGQVLKGNDAKRKGDLDRIKIAVEEYEKDHNCYPQYVTCGVHSEQPIYPYLNNVPCDPVTNASYLYEHDGSAVCPVWFRVYIVLENTEDLSAIPGIGPYNAFNYFVSSGNAPAIIASQASSGPTSSPEPQNNFYGCFSGICTPINWNNSRHPPGPECDPNYQNSSCYGVCGVPANECVAVY
ncbi:MAG: type II secretion system protein [Candidatus Woesebacteria bacterium]|nr:type II secretion system protein [Candidatus Woesebacteria bacterium]